MAKQTTTVLTDDLDGSKGDRTLTFAWSGTSYEIDLSKRNATAFEKLMKPYLDAGRRVRGAGTTRTRRVATAAKPDLGAIREWARANGYSVSERGRIASAVIDAYNAAK